MSSLAYITLLIFCATAAVGYSLLLVQCMRQQRQIERLAGQLEMFVDSGINVARAVDQLAHGTGQSERTTVASRRWIVAEAKHRLDAGHSLASVAEPLGLSKDEQLLLGVRAASAKLRRSA